MKHYLFVNKLGKKFKTTPTGKTAVLKHPQLSKTCVLLGECNEKGMLIGQGAEVLTEKTTKTLKEIMTGSPVQEVLEEKPEVKFEEKPVLKPKKNVKEEK